MKITVTPEKVRVIEPKKLIVEFDNVDEAGHIASILGKATGTIHEKLYLALVEHIGGENYDAHYKDKYEGILKRGV